MIKKLIRIFAIYLILFSTVQAACHECVLEQIYGKEEAIEMFSEMKPWECIIAVSTAIAIPSGYLLSLGFESVIFSAPFVLSTAPADGTAIFSLLSAELALFSEAPKKFCNELMRMSYN